VDAAVCLAASSGLPAAAATGTSKFYPDYTGNKCAQDCVTSAANPSCTGVVENTVGLPLYATITECCSQKFSYVNAAMCKARSDGTDHTNLFYVDGSVCKQDCASGGLCAGNPTSLSEKMFDTAAKCCASISWADSNSCQGINAAARTGTSKFYPDEIGKKCAQDCATAVANPSCTGVVENTVGLQMYATVTECCSQKFSYVNAAMCKARSDGTDHTNLFYVDGSVCKQDCASGGLCAGNPTSLSEKMFDTAAKCCASISWADSNSCQGINAAARTGTSKFYPDEIGKKCAQDCATAVANPSCTGVVENTVGLQMYATVTECCSQKFSYVNAAMCKARSDGTDHTNLFYVDGSVCKQDCASGGLCAGNPTSLSEKMFDTAAKCCASISWADSNSCQGITAAATTPAGGSATTEWYVDWTASKCVQSCDGGGACGGVRASYDVKYATAALCCASSSVSWKRRSDCEKS